MGAVEADLRWYFGGEFEAASGHRSTLGTQLEMMRAGIVGKPPVRLSDDAVTHLMMEAAGRGHAIAQRLRCLGQEIQDDIEQEKVQLHRHRVLELQFATDEPYGPGDADGQRVSLALCCEQRAARESHAAAVAVAKKVNAKSKARSRPEPTMRAWLLWLAVRALGKGGESHGLMVAAIISQARADLRRALLAYMEARP